MPRVVALVTLGVYPPLGEEVYNGCVCVVGEGGCCCCCNSGPLKILKKHRICSIHHIRTPNDQIIRTRKTSAPLQIYYTFTTTGYKHVGY
jgi:hypothetical protein